MTEETTQTKLTKEQKQAVGLLSIGTFLEYFDLMLYVHMAVLLNELFFPKYDPHMASLLAAFAFCSTYLLRPVGALIFGYIGDKYGRKKTVIVTTFMMSGSCLVMAFIPTYNEIGLTATYAIIVCRVIQGMSSMGEIVGAQIYLTEIIKRPLQYSVVSFTSNFSNVGGMFALGVATLATSSVTSFNWRIAFMIGAGIAIIGGYARKALRETPEFVNARKRLLVASKNANKIADRQKGNLKAALAYFFIECSYPVWFYITYVYFGQILKTQFGLTSHEVIQNNLYVSVVGCFVNFVIVYIVRTVHPFKVLDIKIISSCFLALGFMLIDYMHSPTQIMVFQMLIIAFKTSSFPAVSIMFKNFPVLKRFKYSTMSYAMSRSIMSISITFGIIYLVKWYGYSSISFILLPLIIGYTLALNYFKTQERISTGEDYRKSNQGCIS
jgi:MHS family proline/betaine transporter-like MFS transporter